MDIYTIKELLLQANPVSELYLNRYIKFIEYYQKNPPKEKYIEAHHILPSSMFPKYKNFSKNRWNKIELCGKAHLIAHKILRLALRNSSMTYALWQMSNAGNKIQHENGYRNLTSTEYARLKEDISQFKSELNKKRYEDPKEREKVSILSKKRWEDPKFRSTMQAIHSDSEYKNMMSNIKKQYFIDNPSAKENLSIKHKERFQSPEELEMMSIRAKEVWQREGYHNKMSKTHKNKFRNPEMVEKYSNAQIERFESSDEREKVSISLKAFYKENPQARENLSIRAKERFQDPDFIKKHSEGQKKRFENPQ